MVYQLTLLCVIALFSSRTAYGQQQSGAEDEDSVLGGTWSAIGYNSGAAWFDVGISRTGQNIVAFTSDNKLFQSDDYGDTWRHNEAAPEYITGTNTYYQAVASSGDGQYLLLAVTGGPLYRSMDRGVTWLNCTDAPSTLNTRWYDVTVSDSGQYMIALTFGSYAWLSKDYGVNWYKGMFSETDYHIHSTLKADYFAAAISATGQYQMIVSGRSGNADGVVYHSSDYGATFDPAKLPAAVRYLPQHYVSVDNSDSGKIVVVSNTLIAGGLFVSYDYGANFGQITAAPNVTGLVGTQISGNATTMAAYSLSGGPGYIYMSYDYGVHWNQSTAPAGAWIDLAMSQNGQFLLAADYDVALFAYLPYCSAGSVHDGYTAEGVNTCAPCGEGSYTEAFGALTCTECAAGTYSSATGANGEATCHDCAYPWDTLGEGDSSCPVVWLNMPSLGLLLFVGALFALLVLIFLFGNDNQLVVVIIMGFPALDVLTDLSYLLVSRFYNLALFILCVLCFLHPAPMFCYKLYQYRAWPYSLRYIWWLGSSSSYGANKAAGAAAGAVGQDGAAADAASQPASQPAPTGDHIPYPTILGQRFSLIVSFEHHDNLYVVVLEAITWIVAIALQALTLVALPAFLVFWLLIGIFLQMTKTIAMGTVWNVWFFVWTGHRHWHDTYGTVDTEDLNYGLLSQFCLETVPHIILQSVNNTLLGTWVSSPIAILSLVMSIFMAVATIYKYVYHVGLRADPQGMKDIPLDKSVTIKVMFTKIEYTVLNARLEPHSRDIQVPDAEQHRLWHQCSGNDTKDATADVTESRDTESLLGCGAGEYTSPLVDPVRALKAAEAATVAPAATIVPGPVTFTPVQDSTTSPLLAKPSATVQTAYPVVANTSYADAIPPPPPRSGATTPVPCPPELVCPLTKRLMTDPVFCADGYTYERAAIEQHVASQTELLAHIGMADSAKVTSPITKQQLESTQLFPNRAIQAALASYYAALEDA